MSKFREGDRVKIDEHLIYTRDRFGIVREMEIILTGTVKHNPSHDDEVLVLLDYPDSVRVDENHRVSYSYDPRDLTLIPNVKKEEDEKKGKAMFKKNDKVIIDKSLKYTKKRFGTTAEMREIFTGTVVSNEGKENHSVNVELDGSDYNWCYDTRDLTLNPNLNSSIVPISVKTSKDKTTVAFSNGSTTSVKKSAEDPYDLETAIAYCIAKKIVTNSHIKRLAETAEEVLDKVTVEFYNKFLKPYGFLNETAYTDVEIETLKNYLKTLNDVRSEMALIAIENNLTKDELFNKLKG